MRLRKVKNAPEIIKSNYDLVILEPHTYKGKWNTLFENNNPIHIEVGMGKGQFIINMAKVNPEINFIGIEVVESVMVRAIEKLRKENLTNVYFICVNANVLDEIFDNGEIERIYLNFSDPWPKNRHKKRRLTYYKFLEVFNKILVKNGEIHFKTDNQGLFEYSLVSMSKFGMLLNYVSLDLHKSDIENNVMTEYEERFYKLGQRIYRLEAEFKS